MTSCDEHFVTSLGVTLDNEETVNIRSTYNGAQFNSKKPLWVCCNAMISDHTCKYVKCTDCYVHPGRRLSRTNKGKGRCNHNMLEVYDDLQYYDPIYDRDENWPKICVVCKKEIMVF